MTTVLWLVAVACAAALAASNAFLFGYIKGHKDSRDIIDKVREDFRERIELAAKQITLGMTDEQIEARAKESTDAR